MGVRKMMIRTVMSGFGVGLLFIGVFLYALHDPQPRHLPVAVIGSQDRADAVTPNLNAMTGDTFDVRAVPDQAPARRAVEKREVVAAFDPAAGVLYLAGANGPAVTATLQRAFTAVTEVGGQRLQVQDLAPLPKDDSRGLSTFAIVFGTVLAGFIFGLTGSQMPAQVPLRVRLAGLALFSVLVGVGVLVSADLVIDALPGAPWQLLAVVTLLAASVGAVVTGLGRLLGVAAGSALGSLSMLILGNASSGANVPADYLPRGLQLLHPALPAGQAVDGLTGAVHFGGADVGRAVAGLTVWLALGLALIALAQVRDSRAAASTHQRRDPAAVVV